ncbi:PREDICTED: hormonally up-regulated neu tumor-associated kinase homolog [Amphimedon queenslandica]|uniref:non-specific serine/threonine protein kinase n=1 Tax=Amphimedon queenslandica TaxID=400682 RepID=A0A1X7V0S2_AMPQE|nr:PREDICTED: hormonally up-regulated neu tumor-associated kinase homolog [Amphimedon queenslandica]|eukprot:XP_003386170.1 PREDICTED: hormonally up-regulated neu tumor-associated kinase homolog [Amphimedon queenslandica]
MDRDSFQVRDRFPGVTMTLDASMTHGLRGRSNTDSCLQQLLDPIELSRLPPAVAHVPKEDWKAYVHSKKVNNYLVGATLGEGSFAKVKEAFHVLVGEKIALKIIDKKKAMKDSYVAKNFKREARLLQKLRHPNIVQLYEVIETENNYYLITELCSGGELMKHIYKHGKLSEDETRRYVRQIVSAVDHLHKAGLIHRDLKVENLLLDGNMDLKLIDFGLSNEEFIVDETGREIHCRTQCGSPAYAAPELLGQKQYDRAVDIWSIGVNMYAMLTGCLPFTVEPFNITALHAKMLQNKMNPIPDHISANATDLLRRMLTASPDKRITMDELIAHPWLSEGHALPFQPAPYPNVMTQSQINNDIVDHITDVLKLGTAMEIKQDLITNRATSLYAIYNLLASRLARYEKQFPSKAPVRPRRRSFKKKISKDQGFYDEDDSDVSSTCTAPVKLRKDVKKTTSAGSGTGHSRRPISEDFSDYHVPMSQRDGRRLSDILEERRGSVPADLMKIELEKMHKEKSQAVPQDTKSRFPRSPVRYSHPQPSQPLPPAYTNKHYHNPSPLPSEQYEIDTRTKRPTTHSGSKEMVPPPTGAWQSNPPSRSGSRASMYSKLPSLNQSMQSVDLDSYDNIEFHDVGSGTISPIGRAKFFMEDSDNGSPAATTPVNSGNPAMRQRRTASMRSRKNGIVPPSGDYSFKTELPTSAIMSELIQVTQDMRMKKAEPLSRTEMRCRHHSIDMSISIRKKSVHDCTVHFEWLSGGSYQTFSETCSDIISRSKM